MKQIIFLLIFVLAGCSKKSSLDENVPTIKINLDQLSDVSLTEFTDSIGVVSLETNDSCLIASVFKIVKQNNLLYILDQRQNTLFCFDLNGRYHFKINDYGIGPDEYQAIEDFTVTETGLIYLLEPWGNVYCYDKEGKLTQKISLLEKLKSYNEILATDSALVIFSLWGQVLYYPMGNDNKEKIYDLNPPMEILCPLNRSYVYHNKVRTISLFHSKVSELSEEGLMTCCIWDFQRKNNDEGNVEKLIQFLVNERTNSGFDKTILDYVGSGKLLNQFVYKIFENDRYMILLMDYKDDFMHVIYDKKEKKNLVFKQTKENTILHTSVFTNDAFIYYERPFIKSDRNLNCLPSDILKKYEEKQESESNPLITIFYLKN